MSTQTDNDLAVLERVQPDCPTCGPAYRRHYSRSAERPSELLLSCEGCKRTYTLLAPEPTPSLPLSPEQADALKAPEPAKKAGPR